MKRMPVIIGLGALSVLALTAGRGVAENQGDRPAPKVAPGKVTWHATFVAACEAARKSGKPVLLFQMMGKLDEQFC